MALLEVTPEQPNTFWGSSEHDGAFSLPFPKDADFLIVGTQVHISRKQTKRLSYPNPCFIKVTTSGESGLGSRCSCSMESSRSIGLVRHGCLSLPCVAITIELGKLLEISWGNKEGRIG